MKNLLCALKITLAAAFLLGLSSTDALAQQTKQKLDSLIIFYSYGEGEPLEKEFKNEFTYDAEGNNNRSVSYEYDSEAGWTGDSRVDYTFDDLRRVVSESYAEWDPEMNQWNEDWKNVTTYDHDGKITRVTDYAREEGSGEWIAVYKEELTYTGLGDLAETTGYMFESEAGQWITLYKTVHAYDQPSVLVRKTNYWWDNGLSQWILSDKEEYAYHINGKLSGEVHFFWDPSLKEWRFTVKAEYTYDGSGNRLGEYNYSSEDGTDQWIPNEKSEASFDENGNMSESTYYNWDRERSVWVPSYAESYLWDLTLNRSDILFPVYFPTENFNNRMTEMNFYGWDPDGGKWFQEGQGFLYYSEASASGVPDIRMPRARIYPNPATDHLQVESPGNHLPYIVELYDNQGRLAIRKELTGNEQISLENLAAGPYLYKILLNGQTQAGKIIKN
jgi:hypothetical protein